MAEPVLVEAPGQILEYTIAKLENELYLLELYLQCILELLGLSFHGVKKIIVLR